MVGGHLPLYGKLSSALKSAILKNGAEEKFPASSSVPFWTQRGILGLRRGFEERKGSELLDWRAQERRRRPR